MSKVKSADEAAMLISDGDCLAVNASSGLCCPDEILKAIGVRFDKDSSPKNITSIHPIAAGDMFGTKGIDHIAKPGLLKTVIGGSYPSGPSSAAPPAVWDLLLKNKIAAFNIPSGIIFDMLRESAGRRPGVLTKVGLDTFVDPAIEGCAMNDLAQQNPIVEKVEFDGEQWLYFRCINPNVAIIRASSSDEKGNLSFEQEGATLGAMEMALAAHNCGGKVIAQVRKIVKSGTIKPHDVRVPGVLIDCIVEAPDQLQTTATEHDPAISGESRQPLTEFELPEFGVGKIIARRVAEELQPGWAVNIGFGISANVPRILLEAGKHEAVTWMIEQGAVGGIPLLDFKFGCSSNAEAFVASPHQFAYFQAGGFDAALLSFLEIDKTGSVNVSKLSACRHRTAGAGGFVDITARARKLVFSGFFNAGAKMTVEDRQVVVHKEGKVAKLVEVVEQVSFSGRRAIEQGQDVTYITERCVIKLKPEGLVVTEIAPGIDFQTHIQEQSSAALVLAKDAKIMDAALFSEDHYELWRQHTCV